MAFSRSSITALGLVGILTLAAGCAANTEESAELDSQESELNAKGLASLGAKKTVFDEDVTWQYTDRVGRGIRAQRKLGGHIKIDFLGSQRSAITTVWWQKTPVAFSYQPAVVTLDIPLVTNPSVDQHFELLVGFQTGIVSEESAFVVFDAKLPGAVASFLAAYDPTTKEVRKSAKYDTKLLPDFSFYLTKDASGNVVPDATPPSNAATGVGTWPERQADFAYHTYTLHLLP